MPEIDLIAKTLGEYGIFAALVFFFIWQSAKREERLTNHLAAIEAQRAEREKALALRIEYLERSGQEAIADALKEATAVIARNTTVVERLERMLNARP